MKVQLREEYPPAGTVDLMRLEQQMRGVIPSDFADFLSKRNGCVIETNIFHIDENNDSGVNEFLGVDRIIAEKAALDDRLSQDAWPVASAEGGNYVCLRREQSGEWAVVFWDHELEEETVICWSFSEFLESLEKFDPESIELKPGQVISSWIHPSLLEDSDD